MIKCNIYVDFCLNLSRVWRFEMHNCNWNKAKTKSASAFTAKPGSSFSPPSQVNFNLSHCNRKPPCQPNLSYSCSSMRCMAEPPFLLFIQEDKRRFCSAGCRKHESDQNPEGTLRCVTAIGGVPWFLSKLKRLKLPPKWVKQHQKTLKMDGQTWRR